MSSHRTLGAREGIVATSSEVPCHHRWLMNDIQRGVVRGLLCPAGPMHPVNHGACAPILRQLPDPTRTTEVQWRTSKQACPMTVRPL